MSMKSVQKMNHCVGATSSATYWGKMSGGSAQEKTDPCAGLISSVNGGSTQEKTDPCADVPSYEMENSSSSAKNNVRAGKSIVQWVGLAVSLVVATVGISWVIRLVMNLVGASCGCLP